MRRIFYQQVVPEDQIQSRSAEKIVILQVPKIQFPMLLSSCMKLNS